MGSLLTWPDNVPLAGSRAKFMAAGMMAKSCRTPPKGKPNRGRNAGCPQNSGRRRVPCRPCLHVCLESFFRTRLEKGKQRARLSNNRYCAQLTQLCYDLLIRAAPASHGSVLGRRLCNMTPRSPLLLRTRMLPGACMHADATGACKLTYKVMWILRRRRCRRAVRCFRPWPTGLCCVYSNGQDDGVALPK